MDKNFTEDISDILTKENIKAGKFEKGQLLKFSDEDGNLTYIKIVKLNKKKGTAIGKHVQPSKTENVTSHYGHNVDSSHNTIVDWGSPYCTDCDMPVSQQALVTDDNHLSDGTEIK